MKSTNFKGLRVLFLGSIFYGYCKKIAQEMTEQGAIVYLIETDKRIKGLNYLERIGLRNVSDRIWDRLIERRIQLIEGDFDVVLIVKGRNLTEKSLNILKKRYGGARKVLYLWDAIANTSNWEALNSFADVVYTFDRKDAADYKLNLRPLFFTEENDLSEKHKYALSFVGGFHSKRYEIVRQVKQQMISFGLPYRFFIFVNKYYYFFYRYITHRIRKEDSDIVSIKQLTYDDYIQISKDSLAILDINHTSQSGLTIRSVETIGLSKKIITTNRDIVNYDEIDKNQVYVIDRDNPIIEKQFFVPMANTITNKDIFNIKTFTKDILSDGKS